LLRIDDLDLPRNRPGADGQILHCLEAHGLFWDGPVEYQSRNTDLYEQVVAELQSQDLLYPCVCSRKELETRMGASDLVYPGTCRQRPWLEGPAALRLRTQPGLVGFQDRLQGVYEQEVSEQLGDFIVLRKDGLHAYHLATVVDDARAQISEVLRGMDLLESTPRQMLLQQHLRLPTPGYAHVPILVDPQGRKLSKQTGALALESQTAGKNLFRLLQLLRQDPPQELARAGVMEILGWALPHWNLTTLRNCSAIVLQPVFPHESHT
jgi:glutamyl-Q tRNA(Asp) synthetase